MNTRGTRFYIYYEPSHQAKHFVGLSEFHTESLIPGWGGVGCVCVYWGGGGDVDVRNGRMHLLLHPLRY